MKNWKRAKRGESSPPWTKSAVTWNSEFPARKHRETEKSKS
jgi:hypothetical protein